MAILSSDGKGLQLSEKSQFSDDVLGIVRVRIPNLGRIVQIRYYSAPVARPIPASKRKYVPESGTYPKGFLASGIHVGVKASNMQFPDLAIIASETACSAAAVFTKNKVRAAPVTVSKAMLDSRHGEGFRAIAINAGCANAVTGQGGVDDAFKMSQAVDKCIYPQRLPEEIGQTLVMSTGVIGQRLPMQRILSGIPAAHSILSNSHNSWLAAAGAICTTDTFPKLLSRTFNLPSSPSVTYSLVGITKGAGMIHPNMATLLGILATDAPISSSALSPLLVHAIDRSFNAISIDGDMSTNDTIAILSNGAAGGASISNNHSADYNAFRDILTEFAQQLSHLVVRDGEGATKFVRVRVTNAPVFEDAKRIAATVARSPLVKTALFGKDANWGRILCAVGYTEGLTESAVEVTNMTVSFVPLDGSPELKLLVKGEPHPVDETRAKQILQDEDLEIRVDLGSPGDAEASYWFCDFSHEYISINADYRT